AANGFNDFPLPGLAATYRLEGLSALPDGGTVSSAFSAPATIFVPAIGVPANVRADGGAPDGSGPFANIAWDAVPGNVTYTLGWSTTGNGWAFTPLDGGTSFTDFNVTSGNAYYFSVFAKNAGSQPGLLAIPAGPVTIPFTSGPTISASTSSGGE